MNYTINELLRQLAEICAQRDEAQAEVERLRADLRCALGLLREVWSEGAGDASWSRETFALLAKHKEATDV